MIEMIISLACFANTVAIYLMYRWFSEQVKFQTQRDIALMQNSKKLLEIALGEQ